MRPGVIEEVRRGLVRVEGKRREREEEGTPTKPLQSVTHFPAAVSVASRGARNSRAAAFNPGAKCGPCEATSTPCCSTSPLTRQEEGGREEQKARSDVWLSGKPPGPNVSHALFISAHVGRIYSSARFT